MIFADWPEKGVCFLRRRVPGGSGKVLLFILMTYLFAMAALRTYHFTVVKEAAREIAVLAPVLIDRLVVVDPGHGGPDPGVVRAGVQEKEITLAVAQRLGDFLRQGGARVILTRTEDRDLADPETPVGKGRKREDLQRRVDLANRNRADVFVSVHVNSFEEDNECGAQTFYQPGSVASRELAQAIQGALREFLGNTTRLPKAVDYFTGRTAAMPAVVVEVGFITNPQEFTLLQKPAYQSKVAFAIYAGIVRYFAAKAGTLSFPRLPE